MKIYTVTNAQGRSATIELTDAQADALTALLGNFVALRALSPAVMIEEREKAVAHVGFRRNQRSDRSTG